MEKAKKLIIIALVILNINIIVSNLIADSSHGESGPTYVLRHALKIDEENILCPYHNGPDYCWVPVNDTKKDK